MLLIHECPNCGTEHEKESTPEPDLPCDICNAVTNPQIREFFGAILRQLNFWEVTPIRTEDNVGTIWFEDKNTSKVFYVSIDECANQEIFSHTNERVLREGEVLDHWACDINPLTGEIESNGGTEYMVRFDGAQYTVVANCDMTVVYEPQSLANPVFSTVVDDDGEGE